MGFSAAQWKEIDSWRRARREKLKSKLDAIPDPSAPGTSGSGKKKKRDGEGALEKRGGPPDAGASGSAAAVSPGTTPPAHSGGRSPAGSVDRRTPVNTDPAGSGTSVPGTGAPAPTSQSPVPEPNTSPSPGHAGSPAPSGDRTQPLTHGATGSRSPDPAASAAGAGDGSGSADPDPVEQDTQPRGRSRSREGSSRRRERRESSGSRGSRRFSRDRRSRSPAGGSRRRRRSPESSDSASDSDAGYRRDRSHRSRRSSPGGTPDFNDPAWVAQLAGLLGPLVAGEVAKQTAHLQPPQAPSAPVPADPPRTDPDPHLPPPPTPPADSLELLASDEFDEEEVPEEEEEEYVDEGSVPTSCSTEEESPRGTDLPQSLMASVAEILSTKLGFQTASRPTPEASGSRLSATNEAAQVGPPEFPVDVQCKLRLEALAAKQPWTAFPAQQERLVRVPEEDWGALFRPPSVSEETRNKVRVAEGLASGSFREPLRKRTEEDWYQADLAARAGLKFSSVFLLVAEALRRAHLQVPSDEVQFSRTDVGQLVFLLGPLARLVYDQFARVALKAVKVRRGNVLDSFQWPSAEARSRLEQLPVAGPDLFAGQFLDRFVQEVKRHEETASAFFKPPARPAAAPPTRTASRGKAKAPPRKQKPKKTPKGASWRGGSAWRGQPSGRARGGRGGPVTKGKGRTVAAPSRPSFASTRPAQFPPPQP